ncbi:uncharacterized protein EV154DRAFT_544608 [Mucor mucedo]|uniref:uncharacterized protein n=1 Tax=Mucor mucedo TaxID=29922 RepID=UPI00221F094D|nr:uncharacterized protein EV154DRAFT_544608 [Mucor mucedo]KAI7889190.1 hypothetical protein EV154DRAFT_544608 [Mucor mucedo]
MFIPCYTTIDTLILDTQILKNRVLTQLDKQVVYGGTINLNSKGMEPQGCRMIYTDGAGVSILKQNYDPGRRGEDKNPFKYMEDLKKEGLLADVEEAYNIVCTSQNRMGYRYTIHQKGVETKSRKFRKLHFSEQFFFFVNYIEARADVSECFNNYYGYENIPPGIRTPNFLSYRKMKLSSSINMKQSEKRLAKKLRQKFKRDSIVFIEYYETEYQFKTCGCTNEKCLQDSSSITEIWPQR